MTTLETPLGALPPMADEELLSLQLRVARRADELALNGGIHGTRDTLAWLQAEREFLPVSLGFAVPAAPAATNAVATA